MDLTDERGAEAAARYFFELYPYVRESGDTADWDAMSAVTCGFCANIRRIAQRGESEGTRTTGGQVTLRDVSVGYDDLLDGYPIEANYTQELTTRVASDGTVSTEPGESGHMHIDVNLLDGAWRIVGVGATQGAGA